ncbi:MAG: hypothetical protein ABEJ66_03450 [Candidatus Nanohaloarchaea archaeon]
MEYVVALLGLLPPPFKRENILMIENDSITDDNDAFDLVDLSSAGSG